MVFLHIVFATLKKGEYVWMYGNDLYETAWLFIDNNRIFCNIMMKFIKRGTKNIYFVYILAMSINMKNSSFSLIEFFGINLIE